MRVLLFAIAVLLLTPKHKCSWEDCPAHGHYTKYSDAWSIQQTHLQHPTYTYEQCEYILNVDGKDR